MLKLAATMLMLLAVLGCKGTEPVAKGRSASRSSTLPDRYYVTETALRYMLNMHSRQPAERDYYGAYFIDSEEFESPLVRALGDYTPPVDQSVKVVGDDQGELFIRSTGKHVKVWRVQITEMRRKFARAYVFWNGGGKVLGSGSYTLTLRRNGGQWQVESEQQGCVE